MLIGILGYWVEIIPQRSIDETAEVTTTDTSKYIFNHTMLRVKDAKVSLKYYQEVFGMTLLRSHINEKNGFDIYFLGYQDKPEEKETLGGVSLTAQSEGLLELTWNYGTEKEEGPVYHDGNKEPQGFGHICKFSWPCTHSLCSLISKVPLWMISMQHASDLKTWV
jgi:lactoylglutathione lyase